MWTEPQKATLAAILDEIVPPSRDGRIPGAGQLGVAGFLAHADAYAPDPRGAVAEVLEAAGEDFAQRPRAGKVALLKDIEARHAEAFATLVRLTYMGYYSRPDTRPHFGVGAQPVHPQGYPVATEPAELMSELTAPVRSRGACYRATPGRGEKAPS